MNFNTNFLMKRYNKSYHANQIEILLTGLFYDNSSIVLRTKVKLRFHEGYNLSIYHISKRGET